MILHNVEKVCSLCHQCTSCWTNDDGGYWCFESCKANDEKKDFQVKDDRHCNSFQENHPKTAVEIVEKWSKENPQKTLLQDFLEKYPNAMKFEDNEMPVMCPHHLGYEQRCEDDCENCWNRPLEG